MSASILPQETPMGRIFVRSLESPLPEVPCLGKSSIQTLNGIQGEEDSVLWCHQLFFNPLTNAKNARTMKANVIDFFRKADKWQLLVIIIKTKESNFIFLISIGDNNFLSSLYCWNYNYSNLFLLKHPKQWKQGAKLRCRLLKRFEVKHVCGKYVGQCIHKY